jgi:superfamily I DNA/RNA helicase
MNKKTVENENAHLYPLGTTLIGPPGTGKTTYLINLIKDKLNKNPKQKVYFLSFTKKAALEAKDRICISKEQIKNFGTIENIYKNTAWYKTHHSIWHRQRS